MDKKETDHSLQENKHQQTGTHKEQEDETSHHGDQAQCQVWQQGPHLLFLHLTTRKHISHPTVNHQDDQIKKHTHNNNGVLLLKKHINTWKDKFQ